MNDLYTGTLFFPIIRLSTLSEDRLEIGVCGTAFFIKRDGTFVTADHIFRIVPPNSQFYYCGTLPDSPVDPALVEPLYIDQQADVYIGRVPGLRSGEVGLASYVPPGNAPVIAHGYGNAPIGLRPDGAPDLSTVSQRTVATRVVGHRSGQFLGKEIEAFIVQAALTEGMSGGPVLDAAGLVVGMCEATWNYDGPSNMGCARVDLGVVVDVNHISKVLCESGLRS